MTLTMRAAAQPRNAAHSENDGACSGAVVDTSAHQTLDARAPEQPAAAVQSGAFLYALSGIDVLRVANRRVHEKDYAR